MITKVKVYANCDDVYLVWKTEKRINGCRGFAIYRKRDGKIEILPTWVGFDDGSAEHGTQKPSTEWPIQKFMWCDYQVKSGDKVEYQIVPIVGDKDNLKPANDLASDWTSIITVSNDESNKISAYFNRGIVATQWLNRRLGNVSPSEKQKKLAEIIEDPEDKTRKFLAGELRLAMLKLFDEVKSLKGKLYAVLYELDDPELEVQLISLGKCAEVILANGSVKKRGEDQNLKARTALESKINIYDRMLPMGHLAHNKFVVICDQDEKPVKVWTGSTNWTKTGLCTQANNGLLINDPKIAGIFKDQWDLLKESGSGITESLMDSNANKKTFKDIDIWFTPLKGRLDLEQATTLINGAKQGILFLFFNPGPTGTLLNAIVDRSSPSSSTYNQQLYIHGVLNQDPSTEKSPIVGLFHRGEYTKADIDVVLPEAIDQRLTYWVKEIKKKQNAWAMVHSKVVVIDPFGEHPIVITGSHNLGPKASSKNDENLVIIENDSSLAAAYAVNIMSIYNQYRWRYYRMQKPSQWKGLENDDTWQDSYFKGAKEREINFWLG